MDTTRAALYWDCGNMNQGPQYSRQQYVDDFGVKYVNKEDAEHLMSVLKQNYEITEDWEGERYIGMPLRQDYSERKVHLAMPGYVEKVLREFLHEHPR